MTRDPDLSSLPQFGVAPAPAPQRASGFATGLAASMPFLVGLGATVVFVAGLKGESPLRFAQETGWPFYAIVAMTWLSALVLTVTLALAGRGARVPSALSLFFAGLPWVVGVAGVRLSTSNVLDAVTNVEPAMRATLIAQGLAEASGARLVGAWCTAALAGSLALGLAIASLGQRSPNRKPLFGAVGLVLSLPVVALAGYAGVAHVFGTYLLYAVVAALGVVVALTLGAAGAGDSLYARASALSAAVAPAALLSFVAAVAAMETGGFRGAFAAVAMVDVSERASLLAMGAESFVVGGRIANLSLGALGLASLVLAGWAVSRARPTLGALLGGVAVAILALFVIGADRLADLATRHDLGALPLTAWQGVDGFMPTTILDASDEQNLRPVAVVTTDRILPLGAEPIALSTLGTPAGRAAVAATLRPTLTGGAPDGSPEPDARPAMALAIDARIPASTLRALFEVAQAAGAHSVVLVGSASRADPVAMHRLEEEAPLVAMVAQSIGSVTVLLESALPPGYADADPTLWRTTVNGQNEVHLTPRTGSDGAPIALGGSERAHWNRSPGGEPDDAPRPVAYLAFDEGATSETFASMVTAAALESLRPLVVLGPMPGHSEQPAAPRPAPGGAPPGGLEDRLGGSGIIGLGDPRRPVVAGTRVGATTVMGSLDPAVIQRIVRRHMSEVRACYERGLRERPGLAGRVIVRFVISPSGAVQGATVESSTLEAPAVDGCIAAATLRWMFPEPEGGGIVTVTFPFVFAAE